MTWVAEYADLAATILRRTPPLPVRLVAVDGPGGSGKSTFAERLAAALECAPVVHTDDFASHDQSIDWWPLMEEGVLRPLAEGRPARFRPYDWVSRRRTSWVEVPPAPVVLIEGVSSARAAGRDRLTYSVWLQTDRPERLRRGLERDGEGMAGFWADWMAAEDVFYAADPTVDAVDLVADGDPRVPHDPEREFVVIRA
ncbi:MAG: aminodeoxychorismate synthase [Geodermatophilaceae bacterium]|nr:aminodeoxychorismate synthase [Geodermatophilaceae bacterium]